MPLSKVRQAEFQRERRRRIKEASVIPNLIPRLFATSIPHRGDSVIPKSTSVIPKVIGVLEGVKPDAEGFYPAWAITNWCQFNGKVIKQPIPNCPDGRYR